MSNDLKLQVVLSAIDKLTAPFKSAQSSANKLAQSLKQNKTVYYDLKKAYEQNETQIKKYANTLNPLKSKLSENTASLKKAYAEVRRMETAMKGMANPTTAFVKRLEQAKKTVSSLQKEQTKTKQKLQAVRAEFTKNGFEASKMSIKQSELRRRMREANQAIDQQREKLEKLNKISAKNATYRKNVESMKGTSERLHNFGQRSIMTGTAITAPVVGAGKGVVGMAQTAGKFEQFNAILEVTEGSSEKAKQSLEWVKKFAVDTPSNLDESMEAFVKLRAYGLDPTNGLLQTLGDTGAAMGKRVMQAVEMIADALTGENERLKEFGIRGSVIKGTNFIEYTYTDKLGKQQVAKVNKNNRKEIEETLTRIFNEKYAGEMEKQSKTLLGVWSKLEDHWTNFQMKVMETGAFDWIKNKIQSVLDQLDKMSANGELQKWAEDIGAVIQEVIQGLWAFGEQIMVAIKYIAEFSKENKGVISSIVKWTALLGGGLIIFGAFTTAVSFAVYPVARLLLSLTKLGSVLSISKALLFNKTLADGSKQARLFAKAANLLGRMWKGLPNIFTLVGKGVKAVGSHLAKYITLFGKSLRSVLPAIRAFSAALLTNPVFLVIAGIVALIAALYLLWKHWDKVKEALIAGWNWICEKFDQNPILNVIFPIVPLIRGIIWVIQNWGTIVDTVSNAIGTAWENLKTKAGEV